MSTAQELKATERDTTLTPRQLRAAGFVPATIYGKGVEPRSIQVRTHEFVQLSLQGNKEFRLSGLGADITARVQQMQVDRVAQQPLSIEFYQLSPVGASNGKAPKAEKTAKAPKAKAEKAANEAAPEAEAETVTV